MTLESDVDQARQQFAALKGVGIDMDQAGEELQVEGLKLFAQAFDQLLELMASDPKQ